MIKLALLGATGRTGSRVLHLLKGDGRFEVTAILVSEADDRLGEAISLTNNGTVELSTDTDTVFDVLIDFSLPDATMRWLDRCEATGAAMVTGTTGFASDQQSRIDAAAKKIAVLQASNFSVGVNLLLDVVADVARRLGKAYDIEIVEHHHNQKVDAPSGTALSLADAITGATGRNRDESLVHGRRGHTGVRTKGEIGMHAVRMGDFPGRHEVYFAGPGEIISLTHAAHSRDTFARGALEAAAWLAGKPAGRYSMRDVLGGK